MKNSIIKNIAIIIAAAMVMGTVGCGQIVSVGEESSSEVLVEISSEIDVPSEVEGDGISSEIEVTPDDDSADDATAAQNNAASTTRKATTTTQKAAVTTKTTTTTRKTTTTTKAATTTKKTTTTTKKTTTTTKAATTTTASASQKQQYANYWLSYAKSYAKSIGLTVMSGRDGGWDTPLGVETPSTNTSVKSQIEGRLSKYKKQGYTEVYLWLDTQLNNCYQLYIGYA